MQIRGLWIVLGIMIFNQVEGFLIPRMSLHQFNSFKEHFGKKYCNTKIEFESYQNFKDNFHLIQVKNRQKSSYKLIINQFSDQSMEIIHKKMLSHDFSKIKQKEQQLSLGKPKDDIIFDKLDWNEFGFVRPVKNQGSCGSCWAFSTVGSLETMIHWNAGLPIELSEQELVSCSTDNHGCEGGWMHTAMDYVQKNNGLYSRLDYPYNPTASSCELLPNEKRIIESGNFNHVWIKPNSYHSMKRGLFINPVCIAVKADFDFVFYNDGIFDTTIEEDPTVNHAVLLTALDESKKTWTIKNSWGTTWGKDGFMDLLIQNGTGTAGMNSYGIVPIFGSFKK